MERFRVVRVVTGCVALLILALTVTGCGENSLFTQKARMVPNDAQPEWLDPARNDCADGYDAHILNRVTSFHISTGSSYDRDYREAELAFDSEKEGELARVRTRGMRPAGFIAEYANRVDTVSRLPYYFAPESDTAIIVASTSVGVYRQVLESVTLCYAPL